YPKSGNERRHFVFLESDADSDSPRYLPANPAPGHAAAPAVSSSFDTSILRACLEQTAEWKEQHRFPLDVEDNHFLEPPGEAATGIAPWQRVIVDRPERQPAVLVQAGAGSAPFLAFSVQQESWSLHTSRPMFQLGQHWREIFPELARLAGEEQLRQVWRAW